MIQEGKDVFAEKKGGGATAVVLSASLEHTRCVTSSVRLRSDTWAGMADALYVSRPKKEAALEAAHEGFPWEEPFISFTRTCRVRIMYHSRKEKSSIFPKKD